MLVVVAVSGSGLWLSSSHTSPTHTSVGLTNLGCCGGSALGRAPVEADPRFTHDLWVLGSLLVSEGDLNRMTGAAFTDSVPFTPFDDDCCIRWRGVCGRGFSTTSV